MESGKEQYSRLVHKLTDLGDRFQQVAQDYSKELHDYGTGELYTATEVHLVTRIEEYPGITAKQVAEATCRTKSAVSQMLTKLEAKGLVYREKDPQNGRQQLLYVTPKGKKLSLCHKAYDEHTAPMEDMLERFGMEAVEQCMEIMEYFIRFYRDRWSMKDRSL